LLTFGKTAIAQVKDCCLALVNIRQGGLMSANLHNLLC